MMNLHPEDNESRSVRPWLLYLIGGALIVVAFATGVFFSDVMERRAGDVYPIVDEEALEEEGAPGFTQDEEGEPVKYTATGTLTIDWIAPDEQPSYPDDGVFDRAMCYDVYDGEMGNSCAEDPDGGPRWSYKLGTVEGGAYDGRDVVMTSVPMSGMGVYYETFYLLYDPAREQAPVIIDSQTRGEGWTLGDGNAITATELIGETRLAKLSGYVIDTEALIPELAIDRALVEPPPGNEFAFVGSWRRLYSDEAISLTGATASTTLSDGRTLYLWEPKVDADGMILEGQTGVGKNLFYLVDEDGRVLFYDLIVPFFANEVDQEGYTNQAIGIPNVEWKDGSTNDATYLKGDVGGCGFTTVTHVISPAVVTSLDLQYAGVGVMPGRGTEYPVYEPESYENAYYEDAFNAVTFGGEGTEPKTYDDYSHPYFYFQDSFGRWIEFMSNELIPPVECGKPVVYLYPEQETDLEVFVHPRGGFSSTEPEYGDGWDVTAYPDGHLVNRADGIGYPYLFWEGRGGLYAPPSSYWVMARSDVESFLRATLTKMNLSGNETDDFIEFWLPRMQEASYYKIGFHDTRVMDALAPLSFSVAPDHVFRILMDYSELQTPEPSKPPARLPRANREGFDVLEWGGVLR
ncbi:hypothetical protein HY631_02825 [Candidatus Uhrbacteria bacterium]|nr:hypothetical protein [Candidatus Uhrbacteria bacterium]